MPQFERYLGIDYSGAQTPTSSLPGLRLYTCMAPGTISVMVKMIGRFKLLPAQ
jgi:hypothetical protein